MGNLVSGDSANVIIGPARLLVAPLGSTIPTLDGSTFPVTFSGDWEEVGYTEDGTQMSYNVTVKDIMVDEEFSPILKIIDAEKATLSCKCAESTMQNLNRAISASILTETPASVTSAGVDILDVGSGTLVYVMVALEGLSPEGLQRIFVGYKALAQGNPQMAFKRTDKVIIPLEFGLLADSAQDAGKRLFVCADFHSDMTS